MWKLGLGYRRPLHDWIVSRPVGIDCLEITAEHFFDGGEKTLRRLANEFELYVHGLGLSLGTPGPLDPATLKSFARVANLANAKWVSEHVAFTRAGGVDLGHLNPVPRNENSLRVMIDHAIEVREYCKRPLILENITADLQVGGDLDESEFLNRLCESAQCGLLLDVTNLYINARNHEYSASDWLRRIEPGHIHQLHMVGYSMVDGRYHDSHGAKIQDDLLELFEEVIEYSAVKAVILERDQRMDELAEIENEFERLGQVLEKHRPCQCDRTSAQ